MKIVLESYLVSAPSLHTFVCQVKLRHTICVCIEGKQKTLIVSYQTQKVSFYFQLRPIFSWYSKNLIFCFGKIILSYVHTKYTVSPYISIHHLKWHAYQPVNNVHSIVKLSVKITNWTGEWTYCKTKGVL